MCTNQRVIVNKYTGHELYVKCGHCPACLQEKAAHRVSRIKAEDSPFTDTIMCTLTYRRNDCPYVFRQDAYAFAKGEFKDYIYYSNIEEHKLGLPCEHSYVVDLPLNVWRDNNYRKIRLDTNYDIGYKNLGSKLLCQIEPLYFSRSDKQIKSIKQVSFKNTKDLSHCHDKIGVCYYPDVQEFIARLRINLNRNFNFYDSFKAFCCSEYGTKSQRPHFHILFWIPKGTFETFRAAITASWPFSNISNFERAVEKAFRASSYVASYVNCGSDFPDFLKTYFKPKHSYSKDFGVNLDVYNVNTLLQKFYRGTLSFFKQVDKQGKPTIVECPYPKYIISRYFPKFKGYNRLAPTSQCLVMERFAVVTFSKEKLPLISNKVTWFTNKTDRQFFDDLTFPVCYSDDDIYKISVRLRNAYIRFCENVSECYQVSFKDYCRLHSRFWRLYDSTILRLHLCNDDIPINEKYDNLDKIKCVYDEKIKNNEVYSLPIGFSPDMLVVTNPNDFLSVRVNSRRFSDSYYEHLKHRNVINAILSSENEEF